MEIEQIPSPQRIAPHSVAVAADVVAGGAEVGNGRLVLLHDPAGNEEWQGTHRCVTFARAEVDLEILSLEKQVFKYQGAKDQRAAEVIGGRYGGVTPTRYYQRLNQLIDHPEANRLEPALCDRLRTQREDRRP